MNSDNHRALCAHLGRVMVYRAMPTNCEAPRTIRPGDYVTLSRKFATEHAVSSAHVEGQNFDVVRVWVDRSSIVDAANPGEYRWDAEPIKGRVSRAATPSGEIRRPR